MCGIEEVQVNAANGLHQWLAGSTARTVHFPALRNESNAAERVQRLTYGWRYLGCALAMPRTCPSRGGKACVIGAGPNGLAAAITLAQAGMQVEVYEAQPTVGGAARTMELTLPGFRHDFGSAVHPMAAGSPFFNSLPLHQFGLEWIHSPAPLAHPLDNGQAIVLERDLAAPEAALGDDGRAWRRMMQPLVSHWSDLAEDILGPLVHLPRHPLLL